MFTARMLQPAERIYVALDLSDLADAVAHARVLAPLVGGMKIGLELLTSAGAPQVVAALRDCQSGIFFDAKFCDIPNTVAGAVRATAALGVTMLNVHALGGVAMMRAAVAAARDSAAAAGVVPPQVLAVTILTSFTPAQLHEVGFLQLTSDAALQDEVVLLAQRAQEAGCDGVVASPQEIAAIRAVCGKNFLIVTPGVRPTWAALGDQRRVMTPREALDAGADVLVIGRPIVQPPAAIGSPTNAVARIIQELLA